MTETITSKEAAGLLGYSVSYVTTHLLQTGAIRAEKVGGRWRVDPESVKSYVRPVVVRPKVKRGRILSVKKDVGNREENQAALQRQIEAVRSGRVRPIVLERGISEYQP